LSDEQILMALAEGHEAFAAALRKHITQPQGTYEALSAVELARKSHPMLGPRQAQAIGELERAEPVGLSTSRLRVIMKYGKENANTHLTLQALVNLGFAERDDSTRPHTYRLGRKLRAA
jgi:hypothetical protein